MGTCGCVQIGQQRACFYGQVKKHTGRKLRINTRATRRRGDRERERPFPHRRSLWSSETARPPKHPQGSSALSTTEHRPASPSLTSTSWATTAAPGGGKGLPLLGAPEAREPRPSRANCLGYKRLGGSRRRGGSATRTPQRNPHSMGETAGHGASQTGRELRDGGNWGAEGAECAEGAERAEGWTGLKRLTGWGAEGAQEPRGSERAEERSGSEGPKGSEGLSGLRAQSRLRSRWGSECRGS